MAGAGGIQAPSDRTDDMPVLRIFKKYRVLLFFQQLFNGLFQRRQSGGVQAPGNFSKGPELEIQDFRKIVFYRPADHEAHDASIRAGKRGKRKVQLFLPIQSRG